MNSDTDLFMLEAAEHLNFTNVVPTVTKKNVCRPRLYYELYLKYLKLGLN